MTEDFFRSEKYYWLARINVTQAPVPFEPKIVPDRTLSAFQDPEYIRTFLYDPFGTNPASTYGLELTTGKRLKWRFYTRAHSKFDAIELGHAWLSNLKYKFIALDGIIEPKMIKKGNDAKNLNTLEEIVFPGVLYKKKINIIERFINAFYSVRNCKVKLFILWKENPKKMPKAEFGPERSTFRIRIFVNYDTSSLDIMEQKRLKGILRFFYMGVESIRGDRAFVRHPPDVTLLDVLGGNVFEDHDTGLKSFNDTKVNFDFPDNLPLPRLPILERENVRYIDVDDQFINEAISIGIHVSRGVISRQITFVPINKLPQDLAIFGKSGSGKTYFLARFVEELSRKAKNVGILVLNVAKQSQEIYYENFKVIKFSDDNFHIPYFHNEEKQMLKKNLQETATWICASLGLKNVFEKIIYRSEIGFIELEGKLPNFFIKLLEGVENYMNKNQYGPEEQANLMQVFRNRKNVFNEHKIQKVLQLSKNLPKWVMNWMNGEKIFLDLSMCSKFVKTVIINAIFQLLRTITRDFEAEELKQLIVIDEAHAILEKPITTNSDDADFITKEQMAKIFSELLKEYRSRGIGFVIADQSPKSLFDDVVTQPSIKVVFRSDYPNNLLFSEDPKERQMLTQLENRLALVINGATGEKYIIKTLDYKRDKS